MKVILITLLLTLSTNIYSANKPTDKYQFTYYDVLLMKLSDSEADFIFSEFWEIGFFKGGSPFEILMAITPNPVQERLVQKGVLKKDPALQEAVKAEKEKLISAGKAEFEVMLKMLNIKGVKLKQTDKNPPGQGWD